MGKKRYYNLGDVENKRTWDHFKRWQKARRSHSKDYSFVISQEESVDVEYLQRNRRDTTITWIGHATFLIQIGGLNIVTDPVWAKRMGLHPRLTMPGIRLEQMPDIDIVLISHSHYDHLHFRSLRRLKGDPVFFVPAGLGWKFISKGFWKVAEFNWWETHHAGKVELTFVPAQHWSNRTPWDRNKSHWGGWIIRDRMEAIYFAGDSGYFPGFKEIGERFRIDHVMMPIGAYEPEWFMGLQHVSPEEAVRAFVDLRGKYFIPMHYSTFRLADDTPWEALVRLQKEWRRYGLDKSRLQILKLGQIYRPGSTEAAERVDESGEFLYKRV